MKTHPRKKRFHSIGAVGKNMKILHVVDGTNLAFRGYFAVKENTNLKAVKGFFNILLADYKQVGATHIVCVFDSFGETFRHKLHPEYKAHREKTEHHEEVYSQIKHIKTMLKFLGVPVLCINNIEGDDLVGCCAYQLQHEFNKVYISSVDKDFAHLINDKIHMIHSKGEILNIEGVQNKWGVHPNQMVAYLALLGDSVDNIDGVYGIGPKKAVLLLKKYGTLKAIYKNRHTFTKSMRENLDKARPKVKTTLALLRIATDIYTLSLKDVERFKPDKNRLLAFCTKMNFSIARKSPLECADYLREILL